MNRTMGHGRACEVFERNHRPTRSAFTLVELLMVIAVVGLLVGILIPVVKSADRRAEAVACQGQLRQWGLGLSSFMGELDQPVINMTCDAWDPFWRPYCDRRDDMLLCPAATRYQTNKEDPCWSIWESQGAGRGSKYTAWKLPLRTPVTLEAGRTLGSYGMNYSGFWHLDARTRRKRYVSLSNVPVFVDCISWGAEGRSTDEPPAYEGQLESSGLTKCCIDRHNGGINSLFLDWSVRKVELKQLWTLDWSPVFDPKNRWTRAGGVQPGDWPAWMRKFEDH